MAGVIGHVVNPTVQDAVDLGLAAEDSGAEWIGFADAFWWRDVWMLLTEIARHTSRIRIGPAMTNVYMRHPFQTISALATLGELAPDRTLLGVAAGGSEITLAAGIARDDAAGLVGELVELIDRVSEDEPLDAGSGRSLDLALTRPRVLIAGRGREMLRAAGRHGDEVLLWAIPDSELERSIALISEGAARRSSPPPRLTWAPLVRHGDEHESSLMHVAVYASLNTRREVRREWGLDDALFDEIRRALVAGGTSQATDLVPGAALDDLVLADSSPETVAARARGLGITGIATPGFSASSLGRQVTWASGVEALL